MFEQTVLVQWGFHDLKECEEAQRRISELNKEGYVMRFFGQSSGTHYAHCTAVMIRFVEETRNSNAGIIQEQKNTVNSTQSIS